MSITRIQLRIFASFGVALLVIAVGWVASGALSSGISGRAQLQRSRAIIDLARNIHASMLDAELAQRSYLVTRDPAALAAYENAVGDPDPVAPLREMLADDPGLQPTLDRLDERIRAHRADQAETIELARTDGSEAALARVESARSRQLLDAIRLDLDDLLVRELANRERVDESARHKLALARTVVLSGTLLAFGLAVLVNLSLMSAVREREAAQAIVEAQADQLRRQTETLLDHEQQLGDQLIKQQEMSTALRRSNEELDQFAYATSHDLKAPLRGIENLATFVEEDLGERATPQVKQHLAMLRGRARRLEALIEGILAYARAGRVRSKPETVDTAALLRDVVELVSPPSSVRIDLQAPFPTLLTERVPLQQVLMNLIQNAIKHGCSGGEGRIEISAHRQGDAWRFDVRDHGPGIAPELQGRIFGIFQTLAPRDQIECTGIGLAVVKKLVESRGGVIEVRSAPREGATFRFTWPTEAA